MSQMSDNRPTEWQWRAFDIETSRIDGKERTAWQRAGVATWRRRETERWNVEAGCWEIAAIEYAPATLDGLPAAWPAKTDWQWRRMERDMDERTWSAVPMWIYGGKRSEPVRVREWRGIGQAVAEAGEWWAPADQDGNPCEWPRVQPFADRQWKRVENGRIEGRTQREWSAAGVPQWSGRSHERVCVGQAGGLWEFSDNAEYAPMLSPKVPAEWPEVEPLPVVVISAAEMTPLVLYGHQAMGGTWAIRNSDMLGWRSAIGAQPGSDSAEQWSPRDEHGDFCGLRRVVSDVAYAAERRKVEALEARELENAHRLRETEKHLDFWRQRAVEAELERDEWKRGAESAERHVAELEAAICNAYLKVCESVMSAEAEEK